MRRPQLVRDQVPVRFLAAAYARFATRCRAGAARSTAPSGFAEPLAAFAQRMAEAMQPRLGRRCPTACADPPEATDEPLVRRGLERLAEADDRVARRHDVVRLCHMVAGTCDHRLRRVNAISISVELPRRRQHHRRVARPAAAPPDKGADA